MIKIWVNGCFDRIHPGHLGLLEYAHSLGDYLLVGIDGDERVHQAKGDGRPVHTAEDRRYLLKSLRFVDDVIIFNDVVGLIKCLKTYQPDIIVVGEEYRDRVIGREYAKLVVYFQKVREYPK